MLVLISWKILSAHLKSEEIPFTWEENPWIVLGFPLGVELELVFKRSYTKLSRHHFTRKKNQLLQGGLPPKKPVISKGPRTPTYMGVITSVKAIYKVN